MSVVQLEPARDGWDDRTVAQMLTLASSRSAEDRQRLLLKVTGLCEAGAPPPGVAPLLADIFLTLTAQAERDIRLALAERIAGADWAPAALVNMLALDEIEIARPVITASPLLKDADLIRLLIEATLEHQIAVARRPRLSDAVCDAIIDRGEAVTMTALASNRSAQISDAAMRRLVDQSRRVAGLRAPLTRHPRLNQDLAQELYQWVGQALRQSIGERFRIDDARLNAAVQQSAAVAVGTPEWRAAPASRLAENRERAEMERRLVDKLQAAGQLRPGLLVRALREQRFRTVRTGPGRTGRLQRRPGSPGGARAHGRGPLSGLYRGGGGQGRLRLPAGRGAQADRRSARRRRVDRHAHERPFRLARLPSDDAKPRDRLTSPQSSAHVAP